MTATGIRKARAGIAIALVTLVRVAHAGMVTPPAGWTRSDSKLKHAEVWLPAPGGAPTPGGASAVELVVSTTVQPLGIDVRGDAARGALDELHDTARRAMLMGSGVAEDSWQERTDATAKLVEGSLAWRDSSADVTEVARLVITGDAKRLVTVTGECIARSDAKPAVVDACKAALATLDPGIPLADRIAPGIAPPGTMMKLPDREMNTPPRQAPTMSEGSHVPLPPISIPQESATTDLRPMFIGAGIVLLAGVFWWNMRRRARFEQEDQENDDDR